MQKKTTFFAALCLLLTLVGCGKAPDFSQSASQPPVQAESGSQASESISDSPAPQDHLVSTGDYTALLHFLESAIRTQVYRLEPDPSGSTYYRYRGRISDADLLSGAVRTLFAEQQPKALEQFDFGQPDTLQFLGLAKEKGPEATLYVAPKDGGTAVLFEVGGVLPEQRFWLSDATLTDRLYELLRPQLDGSASTLLADVLQTLETGDAAALAQLTGAEDPAIYTAFAETRLQVLACRPLSDPADRSAYTLRVEVTTGSEWLEPGEQLLRLETGELPYTGGLGVLRLTKETICEADETLRSAAYLQPITQFARLFGHLPFEHPSALTTEQIAEFAVVQTKARLDPDGDRYEFSEESVQETARLFFGLEGFDGTGTPYYDPDLGCYLLLGRGAAEPYALTAEARMRENGDVEVYRIEYADAACITEIGRYRYLVSPNGDGSYRLLQCKEISAE